MKHRVLPVDKAANYLRAIHENKVLVGGCFDVLHKGHRVFLTKAKGLGGVLVVLLESDQAIRRLKGDGRPVNDQLTRAKALIALGMVDVVVLLPEVMRDHDYDSLIMELKPNIIATTKGDQGLHHKERQARLVGASLIEVTDRIKNLSSTSLIDPKLK